MKELWGSFILTFPSQILMHVIKFPTDHHCSHHPTSCFFLPKQNDQEIWGRMRTRPADSGTWSGWWPAALRLTFHLLLGSPGVAGSTGHADIVPVDVLEKHLRVPSCQGAGLGETEEWDPQRGHGFQDAREADRVSGAGGEQALEATFGSWALEFQCRRLTLLLSRELLSVPLPFPSQIKIRNQPSLHYLYVDSVLLTFMLRLVFPRHQNTSHMTTGLSCFNISLIWTWESKFGKKVY